MRQRFCGLYRNVWDDFHASDMSALTEIGVPVKYRIVWNKWGRIEDHGLDLEPRFTGPWKEWHGEDLQALQYESRRERGHVGEIWYCSYVEVSYKIPRWKLALAISRDKEIARAEDEQARQEFERAHDEWIEEQKKKLAAYLAKYPWAENPDSRREGWEYIIENDPERGPILIQA